MASSLHYRLPGANWELELPTDVLRLLQAHAQHSRYAPEAAGQLYSRRLIGGTIVVERATVLQPMRASRTKFKFDLEKAAKERAVLFAKGLTCIGLWHTHPEPLPHPSPEDLELAEDHAKAANQQLTGILFLILGTAPLPDGLLVGAHDSNRFWTAAPTCASKFSSSEPTIFNQPS